MIQKNYYCALTTSILHWRLVDGQRSHDYRFFPLFLLPRRWWSHNRALIAKRNPVIAYLFPGILEREIHGRRGGSFISVKSQSAPFFYNSLPSSRIIIMTSETRWVGIFILLWNQQLVFSKGKVKSFIQTNAYHLVFNNIIQRKVKVMAAILVFLNV